MNTNSDDILLLKLIKQGDQIAFRHLFYQYADSLERFITYYIHDREKSQDLVLDIFTYIWENRQNFEIKLTLKAYLFQAARNKSFTYIRDKKIPVYLEEMEGMEIYNRQNEKYEFSKRKVQEETFEYSLNEVRTSLFHSVILYPFERSHIEFKQDIFTTFN